MLIPESCGFYSNSAVQRGDPSLLHEGRRMKRRVLSALPEHSFEYFSYADGRHKKFLLVFD